MTLTEYTRGEFSRQESKLVSFPLACTSATKIDNESNDADIDETSSVSNDADATGKLDVDRCT